MMRMLFWMGLITVTLFSLLAVKPLILGFCILGSALTISLLIRYFCFSWYAFIFFLIYIGGLLVLFFYIASLNSKPVFKIINVFSGVLNVKSLYEFFSVLFLKLGRKLMFFFIFFSFFCYSWKKIKMRFFKKYKLDFRKKLFNISEVWFLFLVIFVLLLVLWIITKLTFRSRGALRPFYYF